MFSSKFYIQFKRKKLTGVVRMVMLYYIMDTRFINLPLNKNTMKTFNIVVCLAKRENLSLNKTALAQDVALVLLQIINKRQQYEQH